MQITLKQHDIVQALRLYVINQGISLNEKNLEVSFTAGRKGAGITADILINSTTAATLSEPSAPSADALKDNSEGPQEAEAEVQAEAQQDAQAKQETPAPAVPSGASLFGRP